MKGWSGPEKENRPLTFMWTATKRGRENQISPQTQQRKYECKASQAHPVYLDKLNREKAEHTT